MRLVQTFAVFLLASAASILPFACGLPLDMAAFAVAPLLLAALLVVAGGLLARSLVINMRRAIIMAALTSAVVYSCLAAVAVTDAEAPAATAHMLGYVLLFLPPAAVFCGAAFGFGIWLFKPMAPVAVDRASLCDKLTKPYEAGKEAEVADDVEKALLSAPTSVKNVTGIET